MSTPLAQPALNRWSALPRPTRAALAAGGASLGLAGLLSLGLHLPDLRPLAFASPVVLAHLGAAVAALVLGTVLLTLRKGRTFHRIGGWTWSGLMAVVAVSSLFIVGVNGDVWSLIHLFSGWALLVLPLALMAARRHDVQQHRKRMVGLFFGALIVAGAFAFLPGRLLWAVFFG